MKKKLKCNVGWSDHTVNPLVINSAIEDFGSNIIEFHLDIDKKGYEYDQGHCWTPEIIEPLINYYKNNCTSVLARNSICRLLALKKVGERD